MDDPTASEDWQYRHIEGFPCSEADQLEDAIAKLITAQAQARAAWLEIGAVSLRLRQLARLRHNAKTRQLAEARTRKSERSQEPPRERFVG